MDVKTHWEKVYTTKQPEAVSWYRPHLETSLALVERAAQSHSASIIDIGAGESTLVARACKTGALPAIFWLTLHFDRARHRASRTRFARPCTIARPVSL
jgi:hypothetical protein